MLAKLGVSKSQMVHGANLNFRLATRYTTQLAELGLIRTDSSSGLAENYWLTTKGEKVLKILGELRSELDTSGTVKSPGYPRRNIQPASLNFREPVVYENTREPGQIDGWKGTMRHLIGYVLVVLAGIGLGYLLP